MKKNSFTGLGTRRVDRVATRAPTATKVSAQRSRLSQAHAMSPVGDADTAPHLVIDRAIERKDGGVNAIRLTTPPLPTGVVTSRPARPRDPFAARNLDACHSCVPIEKRTG